MDQRYTASEVVEDSASLMITEGGQTGDPVDNEIRPILSPVHLISSIVRDVLGIGRAKTNRFMAKDLSPKVYRILTLSGESWYWIFSILGSK